MKIFITGGTGFIGRQLAQALVNQGHKITIFSRSAKMAKQKDIKFVSGNPLRPGSWQDNLKDHDIAINLAGYTVFCRWTKRNRQKIEESRILTTRNLVSALRDSSSRVKTLISGSAIGFYGDCGEREITEHEPEGSNFLATIARKWELEASLAAENSVRVLLCRTGIVLGRSGGALGKMLPGFRLGLGTTLGSGRQWFSWIHMEDMVWSGPFVLFWKISTSVDR
jgi:uncharacterized protein (TIGR01777 family)